METNQEKVNKKKTQISTDVADVSHFPEVQQALQESHKKLDELASESDQTRYEALRDGDVKKATLDTDAIRDFKAIRLPFNEYEYRQLEEASRSTGRSKLNFIRYAMLKFAAEIQEKK